METGWRARARRRRLSRDPRCRRCWRGPGRGPLNSVTVTAISPPWLPSPEDSNALIYVWPAAIAQRADAFSARRPLQVHRASCHGILQLPCIRTTNGAVGEWHRRRGSCLFRVGFCVRDLDQLVAELLCSKPSAARMRQRHRRPVGRACALVFQGPDCVVQGRQGWTEEWRAVD